MIINDGNQSVFTIQIMETEQRQVQRVYSSYIPVVFGIWTVLFIWEESERISVFDDRRNHILDCIAQLRMTDDKVHEVSPSRISHWIRPAWIRKTCRRFRKWKMLQPSVPALPWWLAVWQMQLLPLWILLPVILPVHLLPVTSAVSAVRQNLYRVQVGHVPVELQLKAISARTVGQKSRWKCHCIVVISAAGNQKIRRIRLGSDRNAAILLTKMTCSKAAGGERFDSVTGI